MKVSRQSQAAIVFLSLLLGLPAFGHEFKAIQKMFDDDIQVVFQAAKKLAKAMDKEYKTLGGPAGTKFESYRVTKFSPEKKKKENYTQLYERIAKQALHDDYPITGDDGGYDLTWVSKASQLPNALPEAFVKHDDEEQQKLSEKFVKAIKNIAGLENVVVFAGTGSGNNTIAYIVVVCDIQNGEFFYIVDSNFGSDT